MHLLTWALRYLGQRHYFSSKVWATIGPVLIRRFVKIVILTNIFPHYLISWTLVLCVGKLVEFLITAALRCVINSFRSLLGKCGLWICKNCITALGSLVYFLSHVGPPASSDFWEKKLLRFIDPFTATRDPIKGLNVYMGHIF